MEEMQLQPDFKEFLNLLTSNHVEYLLVGGYAVGYHGYPRTTGDIDLWVATSEENAEKVVKVVREFGFASATKEMLVTPEKIVRMGVPPNRIEVLTSISGVEFAKCYAQRVEGVIDGVEMHILSLKHLRENKLASGRPKDLVDLGHLPTP